MNRNILKISLLVISLLVFQCGIPQPLAYQDESAPLAAAVSVPVNGMGTVVINDTDPQDSFTVEITEPGIYRFNLSYFVTNATPGGVDIDTDWSQTQDMWWPGVGTYFRSMSPFFALNWNNQFENDTGSYDTDLICVRPGYIRIDFDLTFYFTGDQVAGNLTVDQLLVFGTLPDALPLGENSSFEWTTDDTWYGLRLHLPANDLYNFTTYGSLNWSTTAGWGGDGFFTPLDAVVLIDLNFGQNMPFYTWMPGYNVPAGPDTNDTTWGPLIDQQILSGGDYYLLGQSLTFEFLNDSVTTFTVNVDTVPTTPLLPGVPLQLQFNTTPHVYDAYVQVTLPEGHYFDAYFSDPSGFNWTIMTFDAWMGGYTGPYYETYNDPTTNYTLHDTLERGYATAQSFGFPAPGVLGNMYMDQWYTISTYTLYTNGSITGAVPPGGPGISSRFNTFYMNVQAVSIGNPHSQTFNITANLDITPFPELTEMGLTFDFNNTVGPFYHCFSLPQASGGIYSVSTIATDYNASGTVGIEDYMQPEAYRDWQYFSFFGPPLGWSDPPTGTGYSVNTNDTAMLSYVSVRDIVNYLWVLGPGMVSGDMIEANVSLSITPPVPYTFGTVAIATLEPTDFATFTFDVVAGNTYAVTMEIMPDGDIAYGYFMNGFGENPFIIGSLFGSIIGTSTSFPFSMIYEATFTARYTGRVTFAVVGEGTVTIIIGLAQAPLSLALIGAIIGVAIIMLVIGVFIGYLFWKRRAFARS